MALVAKTLVFFMILLNLFLEASHLLIHVNRTSKKNPKPLKELESVFEMKILQGAQGFS